ncbi:MAG TPA: hypothetical protein VF796_02920 [Humisphaera sp.]
MATGLLPEQADLLRRIELHAFDAPGTTQPFLDRLARENGWTLGFARRAVEEYKRFAFLYASSGDPVAPSDVVDQVWHLHLLYTRNYWDAFCRDALGKPLHHEPDAGRTGEQAKLGDWYADTLARYRRHFGEPPADIWPTAEQLARRPKPRHAWVDVGSAVVLSRRAVVAAVVAVAAMAIVALGALAWAATRH